MKNSFINEFGAIQAVGRVKGVEVWGEFRILAAVLYGNTQYKKYWTL